jgi:hypothetical protein
VRHAIFVLPAQGLPPQLGSHFAVDNLEIAREDFVAWPPILLDPKQQA